MKRLSILLLLMVALLVTTGCGSKPGLPFEEMQQIPKDKGVVYFYMPASNYRTGVEITVDNDEGIGEDIKFGKGYSVTRKHYIAYAAPKGENLFRAGGKFVTINVEPKESYFVKITSKRVDYILFTKVYTYLNEVDPTVGFNEIMKTTTMVY